MLGMGMIHAYKANMVGRLIHIGFIHNLNMVLEYMLGYVADNG